jgi:hypothetical protein
MPELLDCIFACLDRDALHAVTQVNRCWNEAGHRTLGRHVTVTGLLAQPQRLRPLLCNAVRSLDITAVERRLELLGWRFPGLRALTFIFRTGAYRYETDANIFVAVLRASGPNLRYVHVGMSSGLNLIATKDEYRPPPSAPSLLDNLSLHTLAARRGLTNLRLDLELCPDGLQNVRAAVAEPFAHLRRLAVHINREALEQLCAMIPAVWSLDIQPSFRFPILDVFAAPTPPPPPLPTPPPSQASAPSQLAYAAGLDARAHSLTRLRLRYSVYRLSSRLAAAGLRGIAALRRLRVLLIEAHERRDWGLRRPTST